MIQLFAFRRTLVACVMALCSIVIVASASPADARPRHRSHHVSGQSYHHHHTVSQRYVRKHYGQRRHHARRSRAAMRSEIRRASRKAIHRAHSARRDIRHANRSHKIKQSRSARTFRNAHAALMPQDGVSTQDFSPRNNIAATSHTPAMASASMSGSGSALVAQARRYIGGNPTGRSRLWCARFMNMVLQRAGLRTTGSDMARSFASYGQRVSGPRVGAIAVMARGKRGGHVGIVSGVDAKGNPIVVSGNHGRRVAESVYARGRVFAYVMPN